MADFNDTLTVNQLIDLVAFLQSHYQLVHLVQDLIRRSDASPAFWLQLNSGLASEAIARLSWGGRTCRGAQVSGGLVSIWGKVPMSGSLRAAVLANHERHVLQFWNDHPWIEGPFLK
jgi:hypothetical protein